jgi:hypothetical protein
MYYLHQYQDIGPTRIIVEGERVYIESDFFDFITGESLTISFSFDGIDICGDNHTFFVHHNASRTR